MSQEHDANRDVYQEWVQPLLEQAAGYAYSIVGNHADAEDAVQEALWKAYRAINNYDRSRPFKGWWFAIVRNCCLDLLQLRRSKPRTVVVEQAHHVAAGAADATEPLRETLSQLSPLLQEVLQLRYFGGCSYQEIAESLAIPTGTVMSRLHAARQALAIAYRKD